MELRLATPMDKDQVKNMWVYALNEGDPFLSWYFDTCWRPEDALVATFQQPYAAYVDEAGHAFPWIGGSLQLLPYTLGVRGGEVKASCVTGVAVLPEVRGQGVAKAMLRRALAMGRERGELISLLYPFDYGFYRRMGYEVAYSSLRLTCACADLAPLSAPYGRVYRAGPSHHETLSALHRTWAAGKHGDICRDEAFWRFVIDTMELFGGYVYLIEGPDGEVEGYVAYTKSPARLCVEELVYTTPGAMAGLLAFVASHFSTYAEVTLSLPDGSPLPFLLANPRARCERRPYVMARVTDAKEALLRLPLAGVQLSLAIADAFGGCGGTYVIQNGTVTRGEGPGDASMDMCAFSQLYMGFLSAKELLDAGRLTLRKPQVLTVLDALFPKQENSINHILTNE